MFTVLFALGRLPGWIAHWVEMSQSPPKIGRPARSTGAPKGLFFPWKHGAEKLEEKGFAQPQSQRTTPDRLDAVGWSSTGIFLVFQNHQKPRSSFQAG